VSPAGMSRPLIRDWNFDPNSSTPSNPAVPSAIKPIRKKQFPSNSNKRVGRMLLGVLLAGCMAAKPAAKPAAKAAWRYRETDPAKKICFALYTA